MNKMIIFALLLLLPVLCSLGVVRAQSQCELENSYFQGGERLSYDLYFKYGIIYTKAGTSSLSVQDVIYDNQNAYRMTMTAKSSGLVKKFFTISDTLASYTNRQLVPLAYTKDAHEEGDYTTERATYKYADDKVLLRNVNVRNGNLRYDTTFVSSTCMYDMVSIVYYARTVDYSSMRKGDKVSVSFFSGRRMMNMDVVYLGMENVSANDKRKYNCVKLSLVMKADAFEDEDEAMRVYLTNDVNKVPVRIDSKLKVGSTRVILNGYEGVGSNRVVLRE